MRVIATAGHVDHGKSTLVRALTGMEPDRWAQERLRGMTIDLGYAWLTLPGGEQLAFVDVPGHERFVPNMLAGLGPVPAVMFVVAADGGWMPQSAEHLAAIDALGVRHGLLVVTRADLADPAPALRQAAAQIAATSLRPVDSVAVSAVTGAGLPELRAALARLAGALHSASGAASGTEADGRAVRLWLDRSFSIKGSGTVVTGTLPAGTVRAGQELLLAPALLPVRVRSLQALGEPADAVSAVARVALNLRGVAPDVPERGMALVEAGRWTLTTQVDIRIDLPAPAWPGSQAGPGEHGAGSRAGGVPATRQRLPAEPLVHIGSARTPARLRVLGEPTGGAASGGAASSGAAGTRAASPGALGDGPATGSLPGSGAAAGGGAVAFARLTLRDPLPLHAGDRLLLRDPGTRVPASSAGAGGALILGATVLDAAPPALRRRGAAAAAARELAAWPAVPRAADLLARHGFLRASTLAAMGIADRPAPVAGDWLVDPARWADLRARLPEVVAQFAARDPLAPGMPLEAARAALGLPSRELVTALARAGREPRPGQAAVEPGGGYLRLAGAPAGGSLPPRVAEAVRAVLADLAADPFAAPDAGRLRALGLDGKAIATAARAGMLLRVSAEIVLAPGADQAAAAALRQLPQPFTTSQARQALGTSRRVAVPLLEYLDRARVTERLPGDLRRVR
ncbi:MAG TPA: SelB C-terminal domain-containing protein [Trebonia sp.]|nr:SelB C-terminal domain-containing protein [Trebonia sp.]